MKSAHHTIATLLLFVGALVAIAGLVWGAGLLPHAASQAPAATPSVAAPIASLPASAPRSSAPRATSAPRNVVAQPSTVAGSMGMRIFKDPNSDVPGPPTEQASALEMDNNVESDAGLAEVTLPDGSVMVDLQGRFEESMVVQLDAHGKRVMRCTRHPEKLHAKPVAKPAQREER